MAGSVWSTYDSIKAYLLFGHGGNLWSCRQAWIDTVDDWPTKVIDAENNRQFEAASAGFAVMFENINQRASDRGTLAQDAFQPEQREDSIVYGIGGTSAVYGLSQEMGTEPYTPPLEPLLDWGDRKFGSEDVGAAAWQTIREEGIEEKRFMRDSLEL